MKQFNMKLCTENGITKTSGSLELWILHDNHRSVLKKKKNISIIQLFRLIHFWDWIWKHHINEDGQAKQIRENFRFTSGSVMDYTLMCLALSR